MRKLKKKLIRLGLSQIHKGGLGVFAVSRLKKGQTIAEGIHEEDYNNIIPWGNFKKIPKITRKKIMDFCIGTPEGFIPPENMDFDALEAEWYFNHSCDGNLGFNKKGNFIALKDIEKDEELSYDYGLAESNPKFRMTCTCKSKKCRKIITGNYWKNLIFRQEQIDRMLPTLRHF